MACSLAISLECRRNRYSTAARAALGCHLAACNTQIQAGIASPALDAPIAAVGGSLGAEGVEAVKTRRKKFREPKPEWIKAVAPSGENYTRLKETGELAC